MLKRCWAANKIMAGATMMTWTNILKKATMMSLIGALGCALLFATEASASPMANCIGKSQYTSPHNQKSTTCSVDHCADLEGSGISAAAWKNVKQATLDKCLNQMPIDSVNGTKISSVVGVRTDKKRNADGTRQHAGLDVSAPRGTPIYAAAAGYVTSSTSYYKSRIITGTNCGGAITYLLLKHKRAKNNDQKNCDYFTTAYLHASKMKVSVGDKVSRGTLIAHVDGCSGFGPHLHFEIRDCDGSLFNPLCTSGKSSPQGLCNASTDVVPPAIDGVQLEDCSQKTAADKAQCEERNAETKRKALEEVAAVSSGVSGLGGVGSDGSGGSSVKSNFENFKSNYRCSIADNYNNIDGCMFCPLFEIIFNSASVIAKKCHDTFAPSLRILLAIGLAISLAMIVMKYVSDMTVKDTGMMLNEIFRKVFVVVLIMVLLQLKVGEFFNIFVTQVFNTGFKLASTIMDSKGCDTSGMTINGIGLPKEMGISMDCAIYAIQQRLEKLMALGSNSLCIAFHVKSFYGYPIFPHFGYLLTGLFLWIIAIVFMVCYPFLLIDSVLQFGVAMSLFPAALAATAFKLTSKYLNIFKVINVFMNAMFVFIFLTVVLFILLKGIDDAVIKMIEKTFNDTESSGFFDLETLGWYCRGFIKMVFFLFLGKAVLEDIPSFAEDFGKSITLGQGGGKTNMGIGRNLGGLAAGAATGVATQVGKPVLKAGAQGIAGAAKATGKIATTAVKTGRYNYLVKRTMGKMNAAEAAGGAAGAFVTGRTWYGKKVSRRVIQNPDGSMALESKRTGIFNRNNAYTSVQNDMMSIKTRKGKNGLTKESYSIKDAFAKSLINKDGTRNDFAVNALMNSAGLTEEQKNKVILNQMLKQRFSGSNEANLEGKFKDEKITTTTDKNGNKVFEIRRTGKNGEIKVFRMTRGKTRDLIEYEKIQSSGNGTAKSTKWASDGAIQKKETCTYETNDDGTLKTNVEATAMINGAQKSNVSVDANGILKDKNGTVQGKVMANGNIVDKDGKVVGTAQVPDLVFDNQGQALGKMNAKGEVVDNNGNVKAVVTADGTIVDLKSQQAMGIVSDEQRAAVFNALKVKAGSRKVEFSNAKAFKGQQIFDDDGFRVDGMQGLELMMDDSDLALYQAQMKKYGDVLQHHRFGR